MAVRGRLMGSLAAVALLAAACGGGDGDDTPSAASTSTSSPSAGRIEAQAAGYDLSVEGPQRFIVGLLTGENRLVSFGTAQLNFVYLGTKEKPLNEGTLGPSYEARWIPIPGQKVDPATPGPKIVEPSDGAGVYEANGVTFDKAGFWGVIVSVDIGGREQQARSRFDVLAKSEVPRPGADAPRTENHLPGADGVAPKAIDSRANDDGKVPDPELHQQTVAAAIASGRPTLLVVSTPVFCVSKFCGPITDAVQGLAKEYGDRMSFVHVEVWRDFEAKAVNKAAAEWITAGDAHEPWVFLIGRDGKVLRRWDNVASEPDMRAAVQQATA